MNWILLALGVGFLLGLGGIVMAVINMVQGRSPWTMRLPKPVMIALVVLVAAVALYFIGAFLFNTFSWPSWVLWILLGVGVLVALSIFLGARGGMSIPLVGNSENALKYSFVILGVVIAAAVILSIFSPEFLREGAKTPTFLKAAAIGFIAFVVASFFQSKSRDSGVTALLISLGIAAVVGTITFMYLGNKDGTVDAPATALCPDEESVRIIEYGQTFTLPVHCSKILFFRQTDLSKFRASGGYHFQIADKAMAEDSRMGEWATLDKQFPEKNTSEHSDYEVKVAPTKAYMKSGKAMLTFVITKPYEDVSVYIKTPTTSSEAEGADFLDPVT